MTKGLCCGELSDGGVDVAEEGFGGGVEGVAVGGCKGLRRGVRGRWGGGRRFGALLVMVVGGLGGGREIGRADGKDVCAETGDVSVLE